MTTLPHINRNGTSAEMLFHDYNKAYRAAQDAIKELERVELGGNSSVWL